MTFTQQLNEMFFNVDVSKFSISMMDSLRKVSKLTYVDKRTRQWNLNVAMEMKSEKAWSSKHFFYFTESPLTSLKIEKGEIEVRLGETDSLKKILDITYRLEFNDSVSARLYFENIKTLFSKVSTKSKFDFDNDVGEIAMFSTRDKQEKGIRDVSFFMDKAKLKNKFEITLLFGSEFMDE
jgi:hypothetical protein